MASNTNDNASMGIAIHPSLFGGEADATGLKDFLQGRTARGDRLYIMAPMSHPDGHAAMAQLTVWGAFRTKAEGGFGFSKRDSFFPRSEAVLARQMRAANISLYVGRDDSFAGHKSFPKNTLGLIKGTYSGKVPSLSSWAAFNALLDADVLKGVIIERIIPLRQRTASVYRLVTADGGFILNAHWQDKDLQGEKAALDAARAAGVPVLEQVWCYGNVSLYKDPGGVKLTKVSNADLDRLGALIVSLDQRGDQLRSLPNAPGTRIRLGSYMDAVNELWKSVYSAAQKHSQEVMFFMMTDLEQMRQDNINHFYLCSKREKWEKDQELPERERIYKPGQLGFHNTLTLGEEVFVLDSDGAGWEDPARVLADFFLNNEQTLSSRDKLRVLDAFTKHRSWDTAFLKRFWAVADLVAMEWILQLLAVLLPENRERLLVTLSKEEYAQVVKQRLERALYLRESFETMEHQCKHDQLLEKGAKIR